MAPNRDVEACSGVPDGSVIYVQARIATPIGKPLPSSQRERWRSMKTAIRSVTSLATIALTGIMTMSWASAQTDYQNPPTVLGTVEQNTEGVSGTGAGTGTEVAFTGFRLTVWVALLVALVAVGLATVWAGRRRAGASKHAA
jgi:hypothetical protein